MGRKRYTETPKANSFFVRELDPKNDVQAHYISTIRESTITYGLGPAGTGKTYIAAYLALEALLAGDVDKILLTRPIVAVEDIGYLPGTLEEKIHPYLLPLFDAIEVHMGPTKTKELLASGSIRVEPLAFMRGRSLNRSFVILDEAQNTTCEQMTMFLTRIGYESKMVITGDATQSDLPKGQENGLAWSSNRLRGTNSMISMVEFRANHIVRNPLIEAILRSLNGPAQSTASENAIIADVPAVTRRRVTPVLMQAKS